MLHLVKNGCAVIAEYSIWSRSSLLQIIQMMKAYLNRVDRPRLLIPFPTNPAGEVRGEGGDGVGVEGDVVSMTQELNYLCERLSATRTNDELDSVHGLLANFATLQIEKIQSFSIRGANSHDVARF